MLARVVVDRGSGESPNEARRFENRTRRSEGVYIFFLLLSFRFYFFFYSPFQLFFYFCLSLPFARPHILSPLRARRVRGSSFVFERVARCSGGRRKGRRSERVHRFVFGGSSGARERSLGLCQCAFRVRGP